MIATANESTTVLQKAGTPTQEIRVMSTVALLMVLITTACPLSWTLTQTTRESAALPHRDARVADKAIQALVVMLHLATADRRRAEALMALAAWST